MKYFFIFLILLNTGLVRAAENCNAKLPQTLTYENLRDWIGDCKPGNVGEVIRHLPPAYRRNASFVFKSSAEAEHDHPGTLDPLHPRVILFGNPDTIISFTGKPGTPSYSDIQIMRHRKNSAQIEFKVVRFDSFGKAHFSESPKTCFQCHGQPARPIWGSYPSWPGVYGSRDDTLIDHSSEKSDYLQFADYQGHLPWQRSSFQNFLTQEVMDDRYLALDRELPLSKRFQRYSFPVKKRNYDLRPNSILTITLVEMYLHTLTERLSQSITEPMKDLFMWAQFGCDHSSPSDLVVRSVLLSSFSPRLRKAVLGLMPYHQTVSNYFPTQFVKVLSGLALEDLSLLFHPDKSFYNSGFIGYGGGFNQKTLSEALIDLITEDFAGPYLTPRLIYDSYVYSYEDEDNRLVFPEVARKFTNSGHFNESYCQVLKDRALNPKVNLPRATFLPVVNDEMNFKPKSAQENPFSRCISCHNGSDEDEAPIIPFGNLTLLKDTLLKKPSLKTKVWLSVESGDMPRSGAPLRADEKSVIQKFLEGVFLNHVN